MPVAQRSQRRALLATAGMAASVFALVVLSSPSVRGIDNEPEPAPAADAPGVIQDSFESPRTVWNQEQNDATITLQVHDRTTATAHEGKTSEHFRFNAGLGSGFFVSTRLPKVPVSDALQLSLFVRANRAGVQLFARVVLPSDTDPATNQPSFLLVAGSIYDRVGRWQRLEAVDLRPALEHQARVLRASTRRPVSLEGAYVEQLVVNLFAGSGETEVFLDEMSVGPVPAALVAAYAGANPAVAPATSQPATPEVGKDKPSRVILPRNRLKKRADDGLYHDWIFTAIHAPGADVAALRNAGFDVLIDDIGADPKRLQQAVDKGFLLMPRLGHDGEPPDADSMIKSASAFAFRDSVMAWGLGEHLGRHADPAARQSERDAVRAIVPRMRTLSAGVSRLTTGIVDDDLSLYAKKPLSSLSLWGIRPPAWGASINPMDTLTFLRQRRNLTVLSNAGALYWALLPATPPPAVSLNIWGHDVPPAWGSPRVQPEQLRWMTYAALSAGYRGLAFHGDADLTRESGPGRPLLLEMALLNAEIDLCESILANGEGPIPEYKAFDPDPPLITPGLAMGQRPPKKPEAPPVMAIRCAAIGTRDKKTVLLLAADYVGGAQFQPMQSARKDVTITVSAPENAEAFEIAPGQFHVLEHKRDVGGMRITIPEFDTTAMILVTTDIAMSERVEAVINGIRPRAVQMAIDQAEQKLKWVAEINGRLATDGHYLIEEKEKKQRRDGGGPLATDEADLLRKSEESIKAARDYAERLDWDNAWAEARRASRPLRILMRGQWANAVAAMEKANTPAQDLANENLIKIGRVKRVGPPLGIPPTASPSLTSFNMLPQHYVWVDWMKEAHFGRNLVPSGSFDSPDTLAELQEAGWTNPGYQFEGVKSVIEFPPETDKTKRKMVKLSVIPDDGIDIDSLPPFLDYPAAAIQSPPVKVRAGQFLRISVFAKRTRPTVGGVGGVVVRDSIGGEELQFVSNEPMPKMTRIVLYRRAPADGELTVTLGLAGYDSVFFDDFRVERVEAVPTFEAPGIARLPRSGRATGAPTAPNVRPIR